MSTKKLFVIPIFKEEKVVFSLSIIAITLFLMFAVLITWLSGDDLIALGKIVLIIYLPICIIMIAFGLFYLEWYNIYEDRIESVCVYKIKNTVYFKDVLFVEKTKISVLVRGKQKEFYIFNDGRKNNNSIINVNSCHNTKKFNLRIYKTEKIDELIVLQKFNVRQV